MILIDSLYVNTGGGKVLLDYLVKTLHRCGIDAFYLFDARCSGSYDYIPTDKRIYMAAGISARHRFYKANKARFSKVFCFGNIPPTVKLSVPVYTYFQNLILIRQVKETGARERFMLRIKSRFISLHRRKTDYFIVQSESIKKELSEAYRLPVDKVLVIPFYEEHMYDNTTKIPGQFLYVSEGYEHKNHLRLLEAWKLVSQTRPELSLQLTVSPAYPALQMQISAMNAAGINITNHGSVNRTELRQLYASSQYLIFPSLVESFGLGLVEGVEAHCEVIAPDLPYIHAIMVPYKTFDPLSAQSIADAALSVPHSLIPGPLTTQMKIKNGINTLLDIFAAK